MYQYSIYDFARPNYNGTRDEILRYHAEHEIEKNISLRKCCGDVPKQKFRSCKEYFVECPKCKARTKYHRHLYEAMQAWNLQKGM